MTRSLSKTEGKGTCPTCGAKIGKYSKHCRGCDQTKCQPRKLEHRVTAFSTSLQIKKQAIDILNRIEDT